MRAKKANKRGKPGSLSFDQLSFPAQYSSFAIYYTIHSKRTITHPLERGAYDTPYCNALYDYTCYSTIPRSRTQALRTKAGASVSTTPSIVVTGQDIQKAYNDVLWPQELRDRYTQAGIPLSLRSWEDTDDATKHLYNQIADKLNKTLAECEVPA